MSTFVIRENSAPGAQARNLMERREQLHFLPLLPIRPSWPEIRARPVNRAMCTRRKNQR